MIPFTIFGISGFAIILLLAAKSLGQKRKRYSFITRLISRGDIHIRTIYHQVLHLYSESKEKISFLLNKQLPIHSKNSMNKLVAFLKRRREQYLTSLRDSRFLKKSDGLSEFFQSLSSTKNERGEIHDTFEGDSQDYEKEVK